MRGKQAAEVLFPRLLTKSMPPFAFEAALGTLPSRLWVWRTSGLWSARQRGECSGDMKPTWLLSSALLLMCGCSLSEAQATRRVGLWEGHPEFRACIRQAVPTEVHYVEVYKACLGLEEEDAEAMECVKDKTPLEDLWQVKMCQRQLRDQVAYGTPNQRAESEPSGTWAGPGIGFFGLVF